MSGPNLARVLPEHPLKLTFFGGCSPWDCNSWPGLQVKMNIKFAKLTSKMIKNPHFTIFKISCAIDNYRIHFMTVNASFSCIWHRGKGILFTVLGKGTHYFKHKMKKLLHIKAGSKSLEASHHHCTCILVLITHERMNNVTQRMKNNSRAHDITNTTPAHLCKWHQQIWARRTFSIDNKEDQHLNMTSQ